MDGPVTSAGKFTEVDSMDSLAFWLIESNGYKIAGPFAGGINLGLTMIGEGGCWGVLSPSLIAEMRANGLLKADQLTHKGLATLQCITAKKWLVRYGRAGYA